MIVETGDKKLERLNIALDFVGVPIKGRGKALVDKTGYSSGMVSRFLTGKDSLSDRFIKAVCWNFSINESYINKGEGDISTTILKVRAPQIDNKLLQDVHDKITVYLFNLWEYMTEAEQYRFYADLLECEKIQLVNKNGDIITVYENVKK
jgi:hypothetical protein